MKSTTQTTTHRAWIAFIALYSLFAASLGLAQSITPSSATTAPDTGLGEFIKQGIIIGVEYVASNGAPATAGYGISMDTKQHGTMLTSSVGVSGLSFPIHHTMVTPGGEIGKLFNSQQSGTDYTLTGVNLMFHWFRTPDWIMQSPAQPVLVRAPANLSEVYLCLSADVPLDKLYNLKFATGYSFVGVKAGFKFN